MKQYRKPNRAGQICPPLPETTLTLEELRHERELLKQEWQKAEALVDSLLGSLCQSMLPADATAAAPVIPATPSAEVAA